ncbi:hypothetical protein [Motilibacter aurantiacus]|uniref:hypothetical protein n=1 Tax=Motilibacter aurantiacus TaxID=2714955 RepID=UPI00140C520D|nr:hypothetical protein [Motilibacter aurantiacus]NHC45743.1 hypothetical protein [Motilibacter aurantiacus]
MLLGLGVAVTLLARNLLDWLPDDLPLIPGDKPCQVVRDGETVLSLELDQAANASTIAGVGLREGMSRRAVTVALATAMQESGLRNLDHGDRDSLGLFQQRPSQGWGSAKQVRDPVYAAGKFYAGLRDVVGWQRMPLTRAAQAVQRSGFPDAYAKHEDDAAALSLALTGSAEGALTCEVALRDVRREGLGRSGLTPRAAAVRTQVERVFGRQSLGGFAPGGVSTGHMEGSAHYEGRALDVFFRPASRANQRSGWAVAHWLVTHARQLHVATVIYDDQIWTARRSDEGWRPYRTSDPSNDILQHRDHVHVDVSRGT